MRIAILTGGETGEREVSIKSAKNIAQLASFAETETFIFPEDLTRFISQYSSFDLVIPVIHGMGGEDGSLQGFLKHLRVPFIFSDVGAHAVGMDKKFTKEMVQSIGIVSPEDTTEFPAFVKPRCGGSSVASRLCESQDELNDLREEYPGIEFVREQPVKGREFSVGIIEFENKRLSLPVVEIIPKGKFFDFESKYDKDKLATEVCPAEIDASLADELQRQALAVHVRIGATHVSRSDFIVTESREIFFLEINTIPGMTDTSLIPKMTATAGLSFEKILKKWCDNAVNR